MGLAPEILRWRGNRKRLKRVRALAAVRRKRLAELLVSHPNLKQRQYGEMLGVTQQTVSSDLAQIRAELAKGRPCPVCGHKIPLDMSEYTE